MPIPGCVNKCGILLLFLLSTVISSLEKIPPPPAGRREVGDVSRVYANRRYYSQPLAEQAMRVIYRAETYLKHTKTFKMK